MTEGRKIFPSFVDGLDAIVKKEPSLGSDDKDSQEPIARPRLGKVVPNLLRYLEKNYSSYKFKNRISVDLNCNLDFYDVFGTTEDKGPLGHIALLTLIYKKDANGILRLESSVYGENPKKDREKITFAWSASQGRLDGYREIPFP